MKRTEWMEKIYGKDWRTKPVVQKPTTPKKAPASTAKED